jgi:hypothetical protein
MCILLCIIIATGHYIGHFQEMLLELQKIAPLSVQQVCGAFTFFVTFANLFYASLILTEEFIFSNLAQSVIL